MGKLGKESLINWGSTNKVINRKNISIFTKRNITYFVSLFLTLFLAFYFSLEKEDFVANVNKTTELYKIDENKNISNNYIVTIHNTQDKTLTFDINVLDKENFRVKKFDEVSLDAGKKAKKILIIEKINDNKNKNHTISIEISTLDKQHKIIKKISFIEP